MDIKINVMPDMMGLLLQLLTTLVLIFILRVGIYLIFLLIKVLKLYIKKNS